MNSTIRIEGLEELKRKFEEMPAMLNQLMKTEMERSMEFIHGRVPAYPPPPPGSTYQRTLTLGKSINTEVKALGGDVTGEIGTNVVYAPYVISSEETRDGRGPQAWMHKGRWWTLQEVVEKAMGAVTNRFQKMVDRLLKS